MIPMRKRTFACLLASVLQRYQSTEFTSADFWGAVRISRLQTPSEGHEPATGLLRRQHARLRWDTGQPHHAAQFLMVRRLVFVNAHTIPAQRVWSV